MFTSELVWVSENSSTLRSMKGKPDVCFCIWQTKKRKDKLTRLMFSLRAVSLSKILFLFSRVRKVFFTGGITDFERFSSPSISRWSIEPCPRGTRWIPMDQLHSTSSWSPTWESACCSASLVPARPNIPVLPSSPQTIMPSMILLSKAVAFVTDMLTTVYQPGATNPANRRPIKW